MPVRKIPFASNEYYHIYNRGNSKQVIFHDQNDRLRFLQLLFLSNSLNRVNLFNFSKNKDKEIFEQERGGPIVSIGAYCLMPNHFHILITQGEGGNISKFMQKVTTGYVMYYNQKYKRTGGLFEGKFKASHISDDQYLKYILSYIHLNPVKLIDPNWKENGIQDKAKAIKYIENYEWSSYVDLHKDNKRIYSNILNTKAFPEYFSSNEEKEKDIFGWFETSRGAGD